MQPHAGDSYPRRHDRMHFYLDAKYQITNKRETNTMYVHPTLNRLYHHKAYKYNLEAHTLYGCQNWANTTQNKRHCYGINLGIIK